MTDEKLAERLSELLAHSAVDEEVDRIAEQDDEVDEESGGASNAWIYQYQRVGRRIFDNHRRHHDGEWEFDKKEHADNDEQHQRRHVGLSQSTRLRVQVFTQQTAMMGMGAAHRHKQTGIETHQQDARYQVNENDAKMPAQVNIIIINRVISQKSFSLYGCTLFQRYQQRLSRTD